MKYQFFMAMALLFFTSTNNGMDQQVQNLERGLSQIDPKDLIIRQDRGNQILDLSGKQLTNISGIQSLVVSYKGDKVPFKKVPNAIVRLNHNQLTEIPAELSQLTAIIELDLSNNMINELPYTIGGMKKLVRLNISHNQITALPESLTAIKSLKYLQASNNALTALPETIGAMRQLTECSVAHNKLLSLPASLALLTTLTKLELQSNALTDPDLALLIACKKLTTLNVGYNKITALPDGIQALQNLRSLQLNHNRINHISGDIQSLSKLTVLDISYNELENSAIPEELKNLPLVSCNLSYNKLLIVNDFLEKLPTTIVSLSLSGNEAICMHALSKLTKLTMLDMSHCDISELPALSFSKLTSLNVSHNRMSVFPQTIFGFSALQNLNLSHNELVEIPAAINQLTKLRILDISYNKLRSLPAELIYEMPKSELELEHKVSVFHPLEYLDISNNGSLVKLPENFGNLTGLRTFKAENTGLKELPASFGQLSNLEYLNLSFNKHLTRLPYSFTQLAHYPEHIRGLNHLKQISLLSLPNFTIDIDKEATEKIQQQQKELRHFLLHLIRNKIAIYAPDIFMRSSHSSHILVPEIKQSISSYFCHSHFNDSIGKLRRD